MMHELLVERFSGKILLAEPSESIQLAIESVLLQCGVDVTVVTDGLEAIEQCRQCKYDLILMDINLSEKDGLETTRFLIESGCKTPIVALAENATVEQKQQCQLAGCAAFMGTPINHAHFTAILACYLQPAGELLNPVYSTLLQTEPEMDDLLTIFIEKLPGIVDQIEDVVELDDKTELGQLLHNLKTMGNHYGFPMLINCCETLHELMMNEQLNLVTEAVNDLKLLSERIVMGGIKDGLVQRYG